MRRLHRIAPALLAVVSLAAACTGSGNDNDAASSESVDSTNAQSTAGDGPGLVDKPDETDRAGSGEEVGDADSDATASSDESVASVAVAPTVLPTVPEIGVPGIDSSDLFCRSWSEFAGTFQALALASSFATEDLGAQRSEVVASGLVIAAVAGLDEHLPDELESERVALTIDLVGPMERRAQRAYDGLEETGLTVEQISQLSGVWLAALVAAGVDEPDIELDIPEDLAEKVEEAVAEFSASVPLIREDPSLITEAAIPLTDSYIVDNCPDQGTLGGNDVIDDF